MRGTARGTEGSAHADWKTERGAASRLPIGGDVAGDGHRYGARRDRDGRLRSEQRTGLFVRPRFRREPRDQSARGVPACRMWHSRGGVWAGDGQLWARSRVRRVPERPRVQHHESQLQRVPGAELHRPRGRVRHGDRRLRRYSRMRRMRLAARVRRAVPDVRRMRLALMRDERVRHHLGRMRWYDRLRRLCFRIRVRRWGVRRPPDADRVRLEQHPVRAVRQPVRRHVRLRGLRDGLRVRRWHVRAMLRAVLSGALLRRRLLVWCHRALRRLPERRHVHRRQLLHASHVRQHRGRLRGHRRVRRNLDLRGLPARDRMRLWLGELRREPAAASVLSYSACDDMRASKPMQ